MLKILKILLSDPLFLLSLGRKPKNRPLIAGRFFIWFWLVNNEVHYSAAIIACFLGSVNKNFHYAPRGGALVQITPKLNGE